MTAVALTGEVPGTIVRRFVWIGGKARADGWASEDGGPYGRSQVTLTATAAQAIATEVSQWTLLI